jgi:hypothetical protein
MVAASTSGSGGPNIPVVDDVTMWLWLAKFLIIAEPSSTIGKNGGSPSAGGGPSFRSSDIKNPPVRALETIMTVIDAAADFHQLQDCWFPQFLNLLEQQAKAWIDTQVFDAAPLPTLRSYERNRGRSTLHPEPPRLDRDAAPVSIQTRRVWTMCTRPVYMAI